VAVVDKVVDKRGTRKQAEAYLQFLFSPAAQEIMAKYSFRPRDKDVQAKFAARFPPIATFTVEGDLGGWSKVQKEHFADGGVYDQIMVRR
jgi:sulfate transport system substrate-binding protein